MNRAVGYFLSAIIIILLVLIIYGYFTYVDPSKSGGELPPCANCDPTKPRIALKVSDWAEKTKDFNPKLNKLSPPNGEYYLQKQVCEAAGGCYYPAAGKDPWCFKPNA